MQARARNRKTAILLKQVVERCALEARAHGTGAAEFLVFEGESGMIWRMGNFKRQKIVSGRGTGTRQINDLVGRLGGTWVSYPEVDTKFIDGTGDNTIYGVEIRLPWEVLDDRSAAGLR